MQKGNPVYGSSEAGHEAFMASIAQELDGTGVTVNVLVPGGRANTNLIPRDTPYDRSTMIQPDAMQAPAVTTRSPTSTARLTSIYPVPPCWREEAPCVECCAIWQAQPPGAQPGTTGHRVWPGCPDGVGPGRIIRPRPRQRFSLGKR